MRNNQPITQREFDFPADEVLMSATDLQGRIVYVNRSFARVCKFLPSEMVGQPHNLIRHPDVPTAAYKDLWNNLERGNFWTGILKNRCKDGDFYWVRANITPIYRDNKIAGYVSVRVKPSAEEVRQAKQVYASYQQGKPIMLFQHGQLIHRGWRGWLDRAKRISLRGQLWGTLLVVAGLGFLAADRAGYVGINYWQATLPLLAGSLLAGLILDCRLIRRIRPVMVQASRAAVGKAIQGRRLNTMDETGILQRAIIQANLNLRTFIGDVEELIEGLGHAAGEIATGSQRLSAQAETAANQLTDTAAAMDVMADSVKRNADNTNEAKGLAQAAGVATARAADMVQDTAAQIDRVNLANKKIDGIVGVINSIAFQTNILALNAAVEAARAGEAGRGFAVVASEVRDLAQRSAVSAREIGTIIGEVVKLTHDSTEQVGKAVLAMNEMRMQNTRVGELIDHIADAGKRQNDGLQRVRKSIVELSQVTQDNASMAEESSAAVHSMEGQIDLLSRAVDIFHNQRSTWTTQQSAATPALANAARHATPIRQHAV